MFDWWFRLDIWIVIGLFGLNRLGGKILLVWYLFLLDWGYYFGINDGCLFKYWYVY